MDLEPTQVGGSLEAVFDAQLARVRALGVRSAPADSPFAKLLSTTLGSSPSQPNDVAALPAIDPTGKVGERLRTAGLMNADGSIRTVDQIWRDARRIVDARDGGQGAAMMSVLDQRDEQQRARERGRGTSGASSNLFDGLY